MRDNGISFSQQTWRLRLGCHPSNTYPLLEAAKTTVCRLRQLPAEVSIFAHTHIDFLISSNETRRDWIFFFSEGEETREKNSYGTWPIYKMPEGSLLISLPLVLSISPLTRVCVCVFVEKKKGDFRRTHAVLNSTSQS